MKSVIQTEKAPKAIGPYSQGVLAGGFLFISGQIPLDPVSGMLVEREINAQTHRVFMNIGEILSKAEMSFSHLVKVNVYLENMSDFPIVNEIYAQYINEGILPARAAVQIAKLPKEALVEIEAIAYCEA